MVNKDDLIPGAVYFDGSDYMLYLGSNDDLRFQNITPPSSTVLMWYVLTNSTAKVHFFTTNVGYCASLREKKIVTDFRTPIFNALEALHK